MIPNGLNPHGLEDRKLVFHLIYDGAVQNHWEELTTRRYCWGRNFPTMMRDNSGTYNNTSEWAIWENYPTVPTDQEFIHATKYVSYVRGGTGNFLMVDSPSPEIHLYYAVPAYTVTWHSNSPPSYAINLTLPTGGYYPNSSDHSVVCRKYRYGETIEATHIPGVAGTPPTDSWSGVKFGNDGWYANPVEISTPVSAGYTVTQNMDCYIHWIRYANYTCVDDDSDNDNTNAFLSSGKYTIQNGSGTARERWFGFGRAMYLITVKPIKFTQTFEIVICATTPNKGTTTKMNPIGGVDDPNEFIPTVTNKTDNYYPNPNEHSWYDNQELFGAATNNLEFGMIDGKFMWEMMFPSPPYFIHNKEKVLTTSGQIESNEWGGASLISNSGISKGGKTLVPNPYGTEPLPGQIYYWRFRRESNGKCECYYSTNGSNWNNFNNSTSNFRYNFSTSEGWIHFGVESDRWADGGTEIADAWSGGGYGNYGIETCVQNKSTYLKSEPWHGVIDMSKSYLVIGDGSSSVTYRFQWDGNRCHHGKSHLMYDKDQPLYDGNGNPALKHANGSNVVTNVEPSSWT